MVSFQELGLRPEILNAIAELGYENPMPIQAQVIPYMLSEQRDLVALAQTGTGKTAAFGLPILTMVDEELKAIQALVLAPTRELCIQISNDFKNYARYIRGTRIVAVYGGENIVTQFRQLDVQPQVLVATPGRLIDLINRGKVRLSDVKYLVLDEADEMLNMGFKEDLETILQSVPEERRTLLFSATMPKEIARIAKHYMKDAEEIAVGTRNAGAENVEHIYYMVKAENRYLALKRIVDMNPDIYGIVFCRTRQETKDVAEKLMKDGYNADALHGDLSQAQRDTVMNRFRIRNLQVLVATDVAARGLDVSDLTHVINYNLPDDVEVYTHRSGRTGRAGKKGVSVSIIHTRERKKIREIERIIKKEFTQLPVPSGLDICKRQLFHLIDKMENVNVNMEQIEPYMEQIYSKLSYLSKEEIISRFVSLEFNRFLDYYKDAKDINVEVREKDGGGKREGKREAGKRGRKVRMKMDFGSRHNANPRTVLGIINDTTQDKSISVGDIEVTPRYTFFDIYADQAQQVLDAFSSSRGGYNVVIAEDRDRGGRRKDDAPRGRKEKSRSDDKPFAQFRTGRGESKKGHEKTAREKRREGKVNSFKQYDDLFKDEFADFAFDMEKPWRKRKR